MKYKVVPADSVNEYLDRGWKLYSNPLVVASGGIYQAVIKEEVVVRDGFFSDTAEDHGKG